SVSKNPKTVDPEKVRIAANKKINSLLSSKEDEETEEVEDKEKEEEKKEEGAEDQTEANPFTALSKELFNLGIFTKEENEAEVLIDNPQSFLDRFNSEIEKSRDRSIVNFLSQFGEDYQ